MDLMLLRIFQQQTLEQCRYILIAANELSRRISTGFYDEGFWRELQNFVVSTANVSKLFWGQGGKLADQRKPLRESIQVKDSSPLKPTTMRNYFEHIDERLDTWWVKSARHIYADHSVGPSSAIAGLQDFELFRGYDPVTGTMRFWGDTHNLGDVLEEVNRIYPLLQTEAAKPHWEE